jgi:hypothetical protein
MIARDWRALRPPATDLAVAVGFIVLGQLITWLQLEPEPGYVGPRATNALLNLLFLAGLA